MNFIKFHTIGITQTDSQVDRQTDRQIVSIAGLSHFCSNIYGLETACVVCACSSLMCHMMSPSKSEGDLISVSTKLRSNRDYCCTPHHSIIYSVRYDTRDTNTLSGETRLF